VKTEKATFDRKNRITDPFKTGAIKFGGFKLSSGKASLYYIERRVVPASPTATKKSTASTANI
jgi:orotate phosphoribosyltransferase